MPNGLFNHSWSGKTNERFWELLRAYKKETECSVLVNTSFNVRDEPIVLTPEDAYRCFMKTEMDALVIGNVLLLKKDQLTLDGAVLEGDGIVPSALLACLKAPEELGGGPVSRTKGAFVTAKGKRSSDLDTVPSLLAGMESEKADPVTGKIKAFYEENPFPNYDGVQNFGDLVVRGRKPSSPPPNPARTELLAQFYDWVQSSRADIALLTKLADSRLRPLRAQTMWHLSAKR